jgi:hypothetical protein
MIRVIRFPGKKNSTVLDIDDIGNIIDIKTSMLPGVAEHFGWAWLGCLAQVVLDFLNNYRRHVDVYPN